MTTLTIHDSQTGKAYNVPEDMETFISDVDKKHMNSFDCLQFDQNGWRYYYYHAHQRFGQILSSSRFTVSFPDTLSKETVREVLREVRQEQVDRCEYTLPSNSFWSISRIASALSLSLEDTNNA